MGRLKERTGQVGPEVPVDDIKEQVESDYSEEVTIETLTERRRRSAKERTDLPITCIPCGENLARPQDLKRHENKDEAKCADRKGRMKASERTNLQFECEKCQSRFSWQRDLTRHKQQKCGV